MYHTLRLILGDQLNENHSWFRTLDSGVLYVMMEVRSETDNVKHHIQKIAGLFLAMRNFAENQRSKGFDFHYLTISDPRNEQSFSLNLCKIIKEKQIGCLQIQDPDNYSLEKELANISQNLTNLKVETVSSEHFFVEKHFLAHFFKGKKSFLMETFYREMRRQTGILMDPNGDPEGGIWNFDAENRNRLPKNHTPPFHLTFSNDITEVLNELKICNIQTIGNAESTLNWPVNRQQSLTLLAYFCNNLLPYFGTYQDAMSEESPFFYHSRLSFSLNTKLVSPREVIEQAIAVYQKSGGKISISQIEGFVRQILGWREYMRGIYWAKMPGYSSLNFLSLSRKLPSFYWTGKTRMKCVSHAVGQSLIYAYAHHIQRLMITGNLALLLGTDPDEVDAWYLGIYMDALEWVEITNTRGMSQFADGGIVGSKPYVASANYINKMSHYCKGCYYKYDQKAGDKSCPFNSLYWKFFDDHREKLEGNPRIGMAYRTWDKMDADLKHQVLETAQSYLDRADNL